MNIEQKFIEDLLEKSKGYKESLLIPTEVELKISEIENFDLITAEKLAQVNEQVWESQRVINDEVYYKENIKTPLIQFSLENDYIKFHPFALKNYLKKKY